jgi:hypothetical protein
MTDSGIPELDEVGRARWKKALLRLFWQQGKEQKALADAIAQARGRGRDLERAQALYRPELSRFLNGDRPTLRRWFGPPFNPRLEAVAQELRVSPTALLDLYERSAAGEEQAPWHPAFPTIERGEIEVDPALYGDEPDVVALAGGLMQRSREWKNSGATGDAPRLFVLDSYDGGSRVLISRLQRELARIGEKDDPEFPVLNDPEAGTGPAIVRVTRNDEVPAGAQRVLPGALNRYTEIIADALREGTPTWVWIVGPPGSGRHTLVERLYREIEAFTGAVPSWTFRDQEPPEGWARARALNRGIVVALVERLRGDRTSDLGLELTPWRPVHIQALVALLQERGMVDALGALACRELADRLGEDPDLLGESAWPTQVIEIVAETARLRKVPQRGEIRAWKTRAAWTRACRIRDASECLEKVGEEALENFFAGLFADGLMAPWTRVSPAEAATRLELATRGIARPDVGREGVVRLLDRLEESARPDRKLVEEVRHHLERPTGEALLYAMLAGGLLVQDEDAVEAPDQATSLLWAARGLARTGFRIDRWERLLESDWIHSAREMAIAGNDLRRITDALAEAPDWLRVDRDRWLAVFLASCEEDLDPAIARRWLLPAWASAIWTTLFGTYSAMVASTYYGIEGSGHFEGLVRTLRRLSIRHIGILPELGGPDLVAAVEAFVPVEVREAARRWRIPEAGFPQDVEMSPDSPWSSAVFMGESVEWAIGARRFQEAWVQHLAPAQCLPIDARFARLQRFEQWDEKVNEAEVVGAAAEAGHLGARAFVAGEGVFSKGRTPDSDLLRTWREVPMRIRMDWIGRAGKAGSGVLALAEILRSAAIHPDQGPEPDAVAEVLVRLHQASVQEKRHRSPVKNWIRASVGAEHGASAFGDTPTLPLRAALLAAERLGFVEFRKELADRLDAASVFHSLGHPEALRRLWREGANAELRENAAMVLLALGDYAPIIDWATDPGVTLPKWLKDRLASEFEILDAAWEAGADGPRREEILQLGLGHGNAPGFPCDWVFVGARTASAGFRHNVARQFHADPRIVHLLRDLWTEAASGSRGQAYWAALLHAHRPTSVQVRDTLRSWALEDPDPFTGPCGFAHSDEESANPGQTTGGHGPLLTLLSAADPQEWPWLRDAAARLWRIRLAQHQDAKPSSAPAGLPLPMPAHLDSLSQYDVNVTLVYWLERLGLSDLIVDASTSGGSTSWKDLSPRGQALAWWVRRASAAEIDGVLRAGDGRTKRALEILVEHGDPRATDYLVRQAESTSWDAFDRMILYRMLDWSPGDLVRVLEVLLRRFPERRFELLAGLDSNYKVNWYPDWRSRGHEAFRRILREAPPLYAPLDGGAKCPAS